MKFTLTPLARRQWLRFRRHRLGYVSLWLLLVIFTLSMGADLLAGQKPLMVVFRGHLVFPLLESVPETFYGGDFETEANYLDPYVQELIHKEGWLLMPPIPYSPVAPASDLQGAAPTPPDSYHWLGTDDAGHDVVSRLLHGTRVSLLFGLILTLITSVIGIVVGVVQGYFGGMIDLIGQRGLEIWGGLPTLYLLIILSSIVQPDFGWLLLITIIFGWTQLVGLVRAETLRVRNFDYIRAAKALGASPARIIFRHILPNALTASLTFLPFITAGGVTTLTALDFIGFGLPPGSASLGDLLKQGKENLYAPWLGLSGFFTLGILLSALIFIGEAARDALDPRQERALGS